MGRFFNLFNDYYVWGTSLEISHILGNLNRGPRPVLLSDVLNAFGQLEAAKLLVEDRYVLVDKRFYLNVFEEWSEEKKTHFPNIVICFDPNLC